MKELVQWVLLVCNYQLAIYQIM